MIGGISSNRELLINVYFKNKEFSNYITHNYQPNVREVKQLCSEQFKTIYDFANFVHEKRNNNVNPGALLIMHNSGCTLKSLKFKSDITQFYIQSIYDRVCDFIIEIRENQVLHGDIHGDNVMIDLKKDKVYIIDWGWCSAKFFMLSLNEYAWLDYRLKINWDLYHFNQSIQQDFPFLKLKHILP